MVRNNQNFTWSTRVGSDGKQVVIRPGVNEFSRELMAGLNASPYFRARVENGTFTVDSAPEAPVVETPEYDSTDLGESGELPTGEEPLAETPSRRRGHRGRF